MISTPELIALRQDAIKWADRVTKDLIDEELKRREIDVTCNV
jgi:hypothetical protein